jgi:hypothetical protein
MSEPREIAERAEPVVDGVWHWRIRNSQIGGSISSSHALADGDGSVVIDPVRLAEEALAALPRPHAICLTAKPHQRAAWRFRRELGAEVWSPDGTRPLEEEPDHRYGDGDLLPGGLRAVRTPGPASVHFCLLREAEPGVIFCTDLLAKRPGGPLEFVPLEYHVDAAETRRSVERLLELPFSVLCLSHGDPVTDDPKAAIRDLLDRTA